MTLDDDVKVDSVLIIGAVVALLYFGSKAVNAITPQLPSGYVQNANGTVTGPDGQTTSYADAVIATSPTSDAVAGVAAGAAGIAAAAAAYYWLLPLLL